MNWYVLDQVTCLTVLCFNGLELIYIQEGIGKDPGLAKQNREDGNSAFQSGNVELSVLLYSEAMRYSPVHPATHEGEEMAAAAANRSAAHFQLKRFRKCLVCQKFLCKLCFC